MDDDQDTINIFGGEPKQEAGEAAPVAEAEEPKKKRRKAEKPQPKPALFSARDELVAARRRAKATERVGWAQLREDLKRGRLLAAIGLAVILTFGITLVTSPDYIVQSVTVNDSPSLPRDQAVRMSGVLGSSIFMVDPRAVEKKLLEAPFVRQVHVQTELPNRVVINIEERKPNVVWVLRDNTPYLISDDGIVIKQATTLEGYVVVYDMDTDPANFKLGDALERDDVIETAQQLYLRLNAVTGLNISQMEYRIAGGLTVVTDSGRRLVFGDGDQLDQKLQVCAALVQDLASQNQNWSKLDLRSPDRVAVSG